MSHGIGWGDIRALLYAQQDGRCHWCHRHIRFAQATTDHVIPRSAGGSRRNPRNLVMSCKTCNQRKGDADPETVGTEAAREQVLAKAKIRNTADNAEMEAVWRGWAHENLGPTLPETKL